MNQKNKPNQTQFIVTLSNLLQTNHPIFKIFLKKPYFLDFLSFFPFFLRQFLLFFNQCLSVLPCPELVEGIRV